MDLLLASGEQIAVSALGLALQDRGVRAVSLTAAQCGIRTDGVFNLARIHSIDTKRILGELGAGRVVIITGFQGITDTQEITTLGRGGSDVTGAAVAAALGAIVCRDLHRRGWSAVGRSAAGVRYPDVAGDLVRGGDRAGFERCEGAAPAGGGNLHVLRHSDPRALEFHGRTGDLDSIGERRRSWSKPKSSGVTSDNKVTKITLLNVPDRPGIAAQVFEELAAKEISIRLIIQSASAESRARITFILDEEYTDSAVTVLSRWKDEQLASDVVVERDVAKISIVGSRLGSTPGLAARMFKVLAREGINIDCISSSEMKVACVIASRHLDRAVKAVHEEFFKTQPTPVVG